MNLKCVGFVNAAAAKTSQYSWYGSSGTGRLTKSSAGSNFYPTGTNSFTIEGWLKRRSGASGITGLVETTDFDGTYTAFPYLLWISSDGTSLYAEIENTSFVRDKVHWTSIPTSGWFHFAWVYNHGAGSSAARHTLIIDGVNHDANRVVDTNRTGNMYQPSTGTTFSWNYVSAYTYSGGLNYRMDEARFWTAARTATQVNDNKDDHIDPATAGLKRYYRVENNANDSKATPINLTETATAYHATDVPF